MRIQCFFVTLQSTISNDYNSYGSNEENKDGTHLSVS